MCSSDLAADALRRENEKLLELTSLRRKASESEGRLRVDMSPSVAGSQSGEPDVPTPEGVVPAVIRNSIGIELKLIPAGTFVMGDADGNANEKPRHRVTFTKPFFMGAYEVTNAQWKLVMGSVPGQWKDDDLPVETVGWEPVTEFCRKIGRAHV